MIQLRFGSLLYAIIIIFLLVGCAENDNTAPTESTFDEDAELFVSVHTTSVDPYTRQPNRLLERQADLVMKQQDDSPYAAATITINPAITYQSIDGFGAALTESSAYLIHQLPESTRNQVIQDLFSPNGIRMNFIRLPMGASDFALDSYTYNDLPAGQTDPELKQFTIQRDERYVIPILKEAFQLNPDIKLMGSPWTAPAWMKTKKNQTLHGGELDSQYLEVYARYFVKFIKAYAEHGLPIYAVTLQNEPLHESSSYPTMKMSNIQQRNLVKKLGPLFEKENITTKIIVYDHNWKYWNYPDAIFSDLEASQYVAGTAFHCYEGEVGDQLKLYSKFPDKGIWFTECSGGQWSTDFASNLIWNMEHLFIGSVNNRSKSVLLWNIALDENFGPTNGGCQNCRGVLEIRSDGSIKKNEEYYAIGHLSKFVEPNALNIHTDVRGNASIIATAFRNPDESIVVVSCNKSKNAIRIRIRYANLHTDYMMPALSVATFVIRQI